MNKKRITTLLIFFLILGIGFGYSYGFQDGVKWAVKIGLNFVEIDVNEEMIINGVLGYKYQINNCFQNASLYINQRN